MTTAVPHSGGRRVVRALLVGVVVAASAAGWVVGAALTSSAPASAEHVLATGGTIISEN